MKLTIFFYAFLTFTCMTSAQADGQAALSANQKIFEGQELHGGSFVLDFYLPKSGVLSRENYNQFKSSSSGGLNGSPSTGVKFGNPVQASLVPDLTAYPSAVSRILKAGTVFVVTEANPRAVFYIGDDVEEAILSEDSTSILSATRESQFKEISLSGLISDSPNDLLATLPFNQWIAYHNFSENASWLPGANFIQKTETMFGDTFFAEDCLNSKKVSNEFKSMTTPCLIGGSLEKIFPVRDQSELEKAPFEYYSFEDGTIQVVDGVRMWISKEPVGRAMTFSKETSENYRVFYELNGSVYMAHLIKDGMKLNRFLPAGNQAVGQFLTLNQTAIQSIQAGIIAIPATLGDSKVAAAEVHGIDLVGIGGHGRNGSLSPADLRKHYQIPNEFTGAGQTIAVVINLGRLDLNDLNTFSREYGLPECNETNPCFEAMDLSNGAFEYEGAGIEATLDVEMVHAIAPQAKIILLTASGCLPSDSLAAINTAAAIPGVTAVSMSFLFGGRFVLSTEQITAENLILSQYQKNQGVIYFGSTGDAGHVDAPNFPATSPYVTSVGGSRIYSVSSGAPTKSDTAWFGSTGGVDNSQAMPPWQLTSMGPAVIDNSQNKRTIPDVSAVGDGSHSPVSIYFNGSWQLVGGTSVSAPIWAGFSAILGESMQRSGKSLAELVKATPGGFNALLYESALHPGAYPSFTDITSGSNNVSGEACTNCEATPGYDAVTGLGSPNVANLLKHF